MRSPLCSPLRAHWPGNRSSLCTGRLLTQPTAWARLQRWVLTAGAGVGAALLLAGCASRSADVPAHRQALTEFRGWSCTRLFDEADRTQWLAADKAYAVDARAGNNVLALGLGVTVFWPALLAMRPDGEEARQLATLKGRFEALQEAAAQAGCGAAPPDMAAERAAGLPVAVGERLVYERRAGPRGPAQRLALGVEALRRDGLEFSAVLDGRVLPGLWRQDLQGNFVPDGRPAPAVVWRRLLRPGLTLGQVVSGELLGPGDVVPAGRLRAQVVAIGPQTLDGRRFDVAVLELFGDVPVTLPGGSATVPGRLEGVMAVDRDSGVLLRLDLRSANPDFTVWQRLVSVEAAAR